MNIEKAIEILTIHNDHNPNFTDADRRDAHQLGVEALKRTSQRRENLSWEFEPLLPGETSE